MTAVSKTKARSLTERAEASRQVLTDARRTEQTRALTLAGAQSAVENIERAWDRGDESQTAEDLLAAQAEVRRASGLHTAAVTAVKRATATLVNDDVSVAEIVAKTLSNLEPFTAFDVIATAEVPDVPKDIGKPVLHVVQASATESDPISGWAGASLDLYLHRPKYAMPLDVEDLGEDLARHAVYADAQSLGRRQVDGVHADQARLSVRGVWLDLPMIGRLNGEHIWGQVLAGQVADYCSRGRRATVAAQRDGFSLGSSSALRAAVQGQGEGEPARIVTVDDRTGERRATVDVSIVLRSDSVGNGAVADAAAQYLQGTLPGTCVSGLGRIVSIEMLPDRDPDPRPSAPVKMRARVTFVSGTPIV